MRSRRGLSPIAKRTGPDAHVRFAAEQTPWLDAEPLERHSLRVEHAKDVVVRQDEQRRRFREWRVVGEETRVHVPVGADDRQGRRSFVNRSSEAANGRVGVEKAVLVHHTPLNTLKPPSTGTTTPVTNDAASLHSQ